MTRGLMPARLFLKLNTLSGRADVALSCRISRINKVAANDAPKRRGNFPDRF